MSLHVIADSKMRTSSRCYLPRGSSYQLLHRYPRAATMSRSPSEWCSGLTGGLGFEGLRVAVSVMEWREWGAR